MPSLRTHSFAVSQTTLGGFLDSIQVDPSGIIRIVGWSTSDFDIQCIPSLRLDEQAVPFLQCFRFKRPDVTWNRQTRFPHTGLALDYLIPESATRGEGRASVLDLVLDKNRNLRFNADFQFLDPNYRQLFDISEVLHREHIYGSGPPNKDVNPEVLELAREMEGPLLDFGCGRGVLVDELRRLGTEAYGLELATEMIRCSVPVERRGIITLYDGTLPSPFKDSQFHSVVCSEVLEHIPDYQAAIRDIARIATKQVIFTVPDASAIPLGYQHGAVPWHLLESTHTNFFNQQNLTCALKPHFSNIEFGRIGWSHFNASEYYVSLVAVCWK